MKESTVPTINLAPKLRRDLSLWNPFDYLLLLYWVFYLCGFTGQMLDALITLADIPE